MRRRSASDGEWKKQAAVGLYLSCAAIMTAIFLLDLSLPLGVAVGVLYLVAVLLTLWTPQGKITLAVALLSSVLIVYVFVTKPPVADMWKVAFNRGTSLFAV
ncbi:MAG: hypothetical protein P4L42_13325 [Desulfocapsaceae bacterium]|nr:hypothetical protein [Desulfocapsaceae bacterium]